MIGTNSYTFHSPIGIATVYTILRTERIPKRRAQDWAVGQGTCLS